MNIFRLYIERVLGNEDGYVNDPEDPGGETKWGISKRSYPNLNIKALSREQAIEIYFTDFWTKVYHVGIPNAVVYQLLDSAVHSGIHESIRFLQRALDVADDGDFGRISRGALRVADLNDTLLCFLAERLEYMTRRKNWRSHGKGWARRIAQNLRYAAGDN